MTEATPRSALPYILPSQAQKHVTHNEALGAIDALLHIAVKRRNANAPDPDPAEGESYLVSDAPESPGAFDARAGMLATLQHGAWSFAAPRTGWLVYVEDEHRLIARADGVWIEIFPRSEISAALIGVNTGADATNRLAVKSDAVLMSHDDVTPGSGDMRLTLNKSVTGATGSISFQTGWTGRAEAGLTGDDDWHVKVSPDGSDWLEALTVKTGTGELCVGDPGTAGQLKLRNGVVNNATDLWTDDNVTFRISNSGYGNTGASLQLKNGPTYLFSFEGRGGFRYFSRNGLGETFKVPDSGELQAKGAGQSYVAGKLAVGATSGGATLSVNGTIKPGSYPLASLPGAATAGAGAIIYVPDESGGGVLAFSDGAIWRRVTDRGVVS